MIGIHLLLRSTIFSFSVLSHLRHLLRHVLQSLEPRTNKPGNTIGDLTSCIDSVVPVSSTIKVEEKNVATHNVATIAASRCLDYWFHIVLFHLLFW